MYITANKEGIRFDNMDELKAYFSNDGFDKDKRTFIHPCTIREIKSFPVILSLRDNGADAATVGMDKEYVLADIKDYRKAIEFYQSLVSDLRKLVDIKDKPIIKKENDEEEDKEFW